MILPRLQLALGSLFALLLLSACINPPPPGAFKCFPQLPDSPQTTAFRPEQSARAPQGAYPPGRLLVRYTTPGLALEAEPGVTSPGAERRLQSAYALAAAAVRSDFGLTVLREGDLYRPELVAVADVEAAAAALERDPRVRYAHPDYYLRPLALPNDPLFPEQWNLADFGLPAAWDYETGTNTVVVAVIDSGVATNHPDLAAKILPGCDFYDDPTTPADERDNDPNPGPPNGGSSEHGTHVAGIVAAIGNNGTGVAGVAYGPGVRLVPIKVFDESGLNGSISGLIDGLLWAAGYHVPGVADNPNPVDIINMSVGAGPKKIPAVDDATTQAFRAGVIQFASAGNDASGGFSPGVQSPANGPNVLAIGSVDDDYTRSSFSDFDADGPSVALMAPGGTGPSTCSRIYSTFPKSGSGNLYGCLSGTSMAAPFAAGVAALLLSQNPNLGPNDIRARLEASAYFDSAYMNRSEYGKGVICADRALAGDTGKGTLRCGF